MKRHILEPARRLVAALLRDEAGQAMVEYSVTTIFMFGVIAAGVSWPFTRDLFDGLQRYIDLYFYALNLALG
ncbi:MAG: Flp family type IVb pilin [Myxococcales bacterium]|jgi:Flp pilus assembly pilin Flp